MMINKVCLFTFDFLSYIPERFSFPYEFHSFIIVPPIYNQTNHSKWAISVVIYFQKRRLPIQVERELIIIMYFMTPNEISVNHN